MAFNARKFIVQKGTNRRISQLAGVSTIKKYRKKFLSREEVKRQGLVTYKDSFGITKHYRCNINFLAQKIRDRKPASESRPINILFVCPEGIGFSAITRSNFNDLVRELGLSDIVWSYSSNAHLGSISRDALGKISYIVPRYNDVVGSIKNNLYKASQDHPPEILPNDVFYMGALNDPAPYRDFLSTILHKIERAHAKLPSQSKLRAEAEKRRQWERVPWGKP